MTELEKKAKEMFRTSDRININLMKKYLNIDYKIPDYQRLFDVKILKWAMEYGFVIEGDFFVKVKSPEGEVK
ncbi:MAG: hypothetical protein ACFFCE_07960 [Promethearchaeota archaeon]